jgi:hypothetical protein
LCTTNVWASSPEQNVPFCIPSFTLFLAISNNPVVGLNTPSGQVSENVSIATGTFTLLVLWFASCLVKIHKLIPNKKAKIKRHFFIDFIFYC